MTYKKRSLIGLVLVLVTFVILTFYLTQILAPNGDGVAGVLRSFGGFMGAVLGIWLVGFVIAVIKDRQTD